MHAVERFFFALPSAKRARTSPNEIGYLLQLGDGFSISFRLPDVCVGVLVFFSVWCFFFFFFRWFIGAADCAKENSESDLDQGERKILLLWFLVGSLRPFLSFLASLSLVV